MNMSTSTDLKERLQTLSIAKDQRPKARAGGGILRTIITVVIVGGVGYGGYVAYQSGAIGKLADGLSSSTASATATAATADKNTQITPMLIRAAADSAAPAVLTATGKIVSDHQVEVSTKVSGQIVEMNFEQGDRVQAGQVLARIEDVIYKARRDEAVALLAKARATVEFERFNHKRMVDLFAESRASEVEVNNAKRALEEAIAQVATEQARLEFSDKLLRDCEVVAPIAGVILERNVEIGDFVAAEGGRGANANAQFGSIADMSKLRVEVDVSELDINRLRREMPCQVVPDAYKDRKYPGRVMWIDPGANYAKATVQVKVRIENPDDLLRVEGTAQVQFFAEAPTGGTGKPTIWLPESAITIDASGNASVYIIDGEVLRKSAVTLGRKAGRQIEITSGLTDGQSIVSSGVDRLTDGQRLR
ncbi:MAG: efflux RND transporter periplasmic adaptor subunit [Phycisphaerae bacterium]